MIHETVRKLGMYKGAAADESCAWYTVAPTTNSHLSHLTASPLSL
jgi:hypothetical protein